ncbi:MAG: hypothetical protein PHO95_06615 [Bacteroidales bacterium]|nr:hypothetical protein [Bacteroidales bacterium]
MKKIVFVLLLFVSCFCFGQMKQEIYLIGSIHSFHLDEKYNYSLKDLLTQISSINPDIVCGEITPEAYNSVLEGYFPPEAAMLAEVAPKMGYKFLPVDWRCDFFIQQKASEDYPQNIKDSISEIEPPIFTYSNSGSASLYNHLHSMIALETNDLLYDIIENDSIANISHGFWRERNSEIVKNGLSKSKGAHKVVFVLGADHISRVKKELDKYDTKVIILETLVDSEYSVEISNDVIHRWEKNLDNLKQISNKQIQINDNYYHKIINSKRISELERFISYYKNN